MALTDWSTFTLIQNLLNVKSNTDTRYEVLMAVSIKIVSNAV
jgi:hypothetical protein